ncbi:MAG: FAD-binding oxidoreductase, partial [Candidatus Thermoplasmatota archaeon]|nr:FAD-binding oxidoreductase [Candidatus Thermoplasmatota archaeon]
RENGVELIQKKSVSSLDSGRNYVKVNLDDGRQIRARKVILATNVWTNDILENSGISRSRTLPIYASLHGIIYLRRPDEYRGIKPTLWDPHQLSYYKMEGSTVTALGSLDPKVDENPVDIHDNLPETADDAYVEEYIGRIVNRLPSMGKATVISTLTGLYDMSPDGQVICDSLVSLGLENVYVFVGLSGHGFKLSPAYGLMAADMITGNDPDKCRFDWRPFNLNRFREGKIIKSKYSEIGTIY